METPYFIIQSQKSYNNSIDTNTSAVFCPEVYHLILTLFVMGKTHERMNIKITKNIFSFIFMYFISVKTHTSSNCSFSPQTFRGKSGQNQELRAQSSSPVSVARSWTITGYLPGRSLPKTQHSGQRHTQTQTC